ncbi:MAG: GIY-YIG nuclease family protein [Patescibacteria group bacterium]
MPGKKKPKYYIYILRCGDGSLYTGWTSDVEKRLTQHSAGKGAKYTRSRLPVELVYSEKFLSKLKALRREREIKNLSHAQKIDLKSNLRKFAKASNPGAY